MPYKLHISKKEVELELQNLGFEHINNELIEEFRKDLLKMIKDDIKKLRKSKCICKKCLDATDVSEKLSDECFLEQFTQSKLKGSHFKPSTSTPASESDNTVSYGSNSEYESCLTNIAEVDTGKVKTSEPVKEKVITSQAKKKTEPMPNYPENPDPVRLYHYYKSYWDKFKAPGEDPRNGLRWKIRSQLFYSS